MDFRMSNKHQQTNFWDRKRLYSNARTLAKFWDGVEFDFPGKTDPSSACGVTPRSSLDAREHQTHLTGVEVCLAFRSGKNRAAYIDP